MSKIYRFNIILMVLTLLVLGYFGYMNFSSKPIKISTPLKISVAEARARRFNLIIDVRTPKEREILGIYPNSIPISLDMLTMEIPLDISNKNAWILVYSNGDDRAAKAADTLYKMGYKNVKYINETYLALLPGSSY